MQFTTPGRGDLKFDRGEAGQLKFQPRRDEATKISTETGRDRGRVTWNLTGAERDRGWGDLEFDRGGAT